MSLLNISKDIHSLTDFKRKTSQLIKQMRETCHPLVLTVNGKAELVVQDAEAYQVLLELVDRMEAVEGIRRGLEEMKAGKGRPAEEVFKEIRNKHKIPRSA
jgi:prevent-host-death family protein